MPKLREDEDIREGLVESLRKLDLLAEVVERGNAKLPLTLSMHL